MGSRREIVTILARVGIAGSPGAYGRLHSHQARSSIGQKKVMLTSQTIPRGGTAPAIITAPVNRGSAARRDKLVHRIQF